MATETKPRLAVTVEADRMKASLSVPSGAQADGLSAEEVTAALEAAKVVVDEGVTARIQQFLELAGEQGQPPETFVIAEGRPPVEGEPGRFIRDESRKDQEDDDEEARIDHRSLNMIHTVEKDEVIGKVLPPVPGEPGVDVHGAEISPKKRTEPIKLQENMRLADDGQTVIAQEAGRVVLKRDKLEIRPVLEIKGDVDFESGHIKATTDVTIRGTVRDLFEVTSKKSITVGGAIEAARVEAGQDVEVRGGILARSKGIVRAQGQITAKFCDEACLHAEGDIQIAKEAINSHLYTLGKLESQRAAIIGGEVYARLGAEVHTIGSDACVPTRITVGVHPRVIKKIRELEEETNKQQESVEKIRAIVQPLLDNVKRLMPNQKEQATELLYQADEIEQSMKTKQTQQEEMIAKARPESPATVTVQSRICQNAVVAIDDREVRFNNDLKGPLRIEKRKVENVTEFVAMNTLTGSITTLNSTDTDLSQITDEEVDPFEQANASDQPNAKQ